MAVTSEGVTPSAPLVGIGMIGCGFMGRVHSSALRRLPQAVWPPPLVPRLVAVAGRSSERLDEMAARFGYLSAYQHWEDLIADERVQVVDNTGPNDLHAEPCIAAAQAGKDVICEKPLARGAPEALRMLQAVEAAGVKHLCAFNYRFVPAVRLAKQLIDRGELGRILQVRVQYLQSSLADPAAPWRWRHARESAGHGVLGDLGSHVVDLTRFLVGEPASVMGSVRTFFPERPLADQPSRLAPVSTDDAFQAIVEFAGGAVGYLAASKVSLGALNRLALEIDGTEGSLRFNLERLNELAVYLRRDEGAGVAGFRTVNVTWPDHPFASTWWPRHPLGWDHTFVHELAHFFATVAGDSAVAPLGATFEDGYRAAVICDAIAASAEGGSRVAITYADTASS